MIDTIRLRFENNYNILNPSAFTPNADLITNPDYARKRVMKAVLNPSPVEKALLHYGPRLTLVRPFKGSSEHLLFLEVSLPKLLFGNNLEELTESDFELLVDRLYGWLRSHDILIHKEVIRNAAVTSIHYGKNIILPRFLRCLSLLRSLSKVPAHRWEDVACVDYRNDGHLYKIHTNGYEVAFYDKVKDFEKNQKSPKRSHEADFQVQQKLFHEASKTQAQILRMEVRLNQRKHIKKTLERAGLTDHDLTFKTLFQTSYAQGCLWVWWQPFKVALPSILQAEGNTPSKLLDDLRQAEPNAPLDTQLKDLGLLLLAADMGWPALQTLYKLDSTHRTGHAHFKRLAALPIGLNGPMAAIKVVDEALQAFQPIRANDVLTVLSKDYQAEGCNE